MNFIKFTDYGGKHFESLANVLVAIKYIFEVLNEVSYLKIVKIEEFQTFQFIDFLLGQC